MLHNSGKVLQNSHMPLQALWLLGNPKRALLNQQRSLKILQTLVFLQ
jgi:hypothetical protein